MMSGKNTVSRWKQRAGEKKHLKRAARCVDMSLETLEARWLLSAATWVGGAGGNWNVASNWSTDAVPGASDAVTLNSGASLELTDAENCATITADANSTISLVGGSLDVRTSGLINGTVGGSGSFTGPTTQGNALTFAGTTTFDTASGLNNGNFQNTGSMTFFSGIMHGSSLNNSGTIDFDSNTTSGMGLNTTLTNQGSGTLSFADGALLGFDTYGTGGSFPNVINYGAITKTGSASGGFSSENGAAIRLQDIGGTINSQGGNLDIPIPGAFQNTTFEAAASATITLDDTNGAVEYSFSGTVTGSGAGHLVMADSGANTANPAIQNSNPSTAAILNFSGGFAQVSGMYFQANTYTVVNQGTLNYVGSTTDGNAGLDNTGTINVTGTGDFDVNRNGNFTNDTTGILDFQSDAGVTDDNGGTSFINKGLVEKTGGTGTSIIGDGTANIGFVNVGGTYDVESGTLDIANGGGDFGFAIPDNGVVAAPGATFALGKSNGGNRIFVQGNLSISGGGTFELLGGALYGPNGGYNQNTSAPSTLNFTGDQLLVNGGGFNDNVNLINKGDIDFQAGDLGTLLNQGTVTLGSGVIVDSGAFINAVGAMLLSGTSDGIYRQGNNGNVQNAGTFVMSPGTGNTFDMSGTEISNTGTLIFGPGTSNLPWIANGYDEYPSLFPSGNSIPTGSTFVLQSGAIVTIDTSPSLKEIDGTVIMSGGSSFAAIADLNTITGQFAVLSGESFSTAGNLLNNGTLNVGGTFTVNGDYTQAAQMYVSSPPTPTLDFEIAADPTSANAPNFTVTGNTSLAGNLTADYVNGYTTSGGTWTVATFDNAATGNFDSTAGTAPYFTPTVSASQIMLAGTAFTGTGGSSLGGGSGNNGGGGGNGGGGTTGGSVDLNVTSVSAPANFMAGQSETLTWNVQNNGTGATSGNWQDSVYLSSDQTVGPDDVLLGRVTESSSVTAGGSYTGTLTTNMPAVLPGTYYVIVVADSREVLGDTNYSNNTAVSAASTETVPSLTLGQTTSGNVSASQQQLYSLRLQSGQVVKFSATFATPLEAELFIGDNAIPTPTSNIAAATNPSQTTASLLLTAPVAGTYYVLVDGRPDVSGAQSFSLMPTLLPYGPASVSPAAAAAVYQTTITVQGNGFTPSTVVNLVAGSTTIAANNVTFVNAQTLYATYALYNVTPGIYDVQTVEPDGTNASLAAAFTINAFNPAATSANSIGQVVFYFSAPAHVRVGGTAVATLSYENIGGTEVDAPLFEIDGTNANFQLPGMTTFDSGSIDIIGIASSGPAGVLEPGQGGSVQITYEQDDNDPAHTVSDLTAFLLNPTNTIDWDAAKTPLKPDDQSQQAWDTTWANFESLVGVVVNNKLQDTVGSYEQELSWIATQLGSQGYRTNDLGRYLSQIEQIAGDFGTINQRDTLTSFGYGQSDPYDISLTLDSSGNAAVGNTDDYEYFLVQSDGTFVNEDAPNDPTTLVRNSDGTYTVTESDGSKEIFNSDGSLNSFVDANGNQTTVTLTNGYVTALTNPLGQVTTINRTSTGMVSSIVEPNGQTESFTYDSDDNLTSVTTPYGTTTYTYADPTSHEVTNILNADGTQQNYTYDSFGRINTESSTNGADQITFTYDSLGNETVTDALNRSYFLERQADGSIASITDALGNISSMAAGNIAAPSSETDSQGVSTLFGTNSNGDITSITQATGATITLNYNSSHQLVSVVDPDNNTTTFTYDANGNLLISTDAASATTTYTYTALGLLQSTTTPAGRVINNSYNAQGELVGQTFSDGSSDTYAYNSNGEISAATNSFGTDTLTYDSAGRLTEVTYPDGLSLTYTYNSSGQLISTTDQSGFVTNYAYTPQGQLDLVTDSTGATEVAYTYDASGHVIRADEGNGTYTLYGYDADARINSVVNYGADGQVQSSYTYTYDGDGRVSSMTTLAGTATYTYDAAGQLISAALPGGETLTWIYDAAGNIISQTDTSAGTTTFTTNKLNEYTTVGNTTYTYDADGNLISSTTGGQTTTYTYNIEQQLVSITSPSGTTTFTYDALGNRVAETVNGVTSDLLYDPLQDQLAGEFSTTGTPQAQFIYGIGLAGESLSSTAADYYQFDMAGNVVGLTGSTGSVLNTYSYLPFGQTLSSIGSTANAFTFDGRDDVLSLGNGNYLTQSRLYSSTLGRFTQRDSDGLTGGDINLYRYANNDPVTYADPSGHIIGLEDAWGFAQKALGGSTGQILNEAYIEAQNAASEVYTEGETFVSNLEANTGGVFSEAGTFLSNEGIPAAFNEYAPQVTKVATTFGAVVYQYGAAFISGAQTVATAAATVAPPVLAAGAIGFTGYALTHQNQAQRFFNREFGYLANISPEDYGDVGIPKQQIIAALSRTKLGALAISQGVNLQNLTIETLISLLKQAVREQQHQQTESSGAKDPNDIIGPAGYGSAGFIPAGGVLPYQILFTNESTASAPAAVVTITEQISSNLDWSTFAFGSLGFGSNTFTPPAGAQQYSTTFALSSTLTLDIVANFDAATGVATWTFTTIDNSTGDVPSDPTLGFLPPDVTSPEGEGFVNYTASPLSTLTTGATISAQASIVFDNNAAIATSTVTNTIDAVAPTSTITALPATATSTYFNLTWTGTDDANGSGIAGYNIYVSEDGGAYTLFLANTNASSAQFVGTPGHSYSFYSIATDNAGNQQSVPASGQASTTIPAIARTIAFGGKTKATYTDSSGHVVTLTLSSGSGTLSFLSNGNADPISLDITGTTAKSALTIKVSGGTATLGTVTINGSLKSFNAPDANFTDTFTITGTLGSLTLGDETLTKSAIDIEGANVPTTIKLGTVHDLSLTDASAIKSLSALAWTAGPFNADAITAPSIGTLTVKGNFDPAINLTAAGLDLKSEKITGNITGGSLTAAGSVGIISANSIASTWTSTVTGSVTTIQTKGDFDGQLTAASLGTGKISGNLAGATLSFTGSSEGYALHAFSVAKSVTNSVISTVSNVDVFTVGGMSNSKLLIGVAAGTTALPTNASAFTASAALARFTSKGSSAFSNTIIAAATIDQAKLANVTTNNNGTAFGLSTKSLQAFTLSQSGAKPIVYTKKSLPSVLSNLPGDLKVEVV
ncbi:MAG TPA: RHS repeat-associated core domain-containing protein [Tepidisphaeraceae bacterium]|jgi:RHS repeat-associated protein